MQTEQASGAVTLQMSPARDRKLIELQSEILGVSRAMRRDPETSEMEGETVTHRRVLSSVNAGSDVKR